MIGMTAWQNFLQLVLAPTSRSLMQAAAARQCQSPRKKTMQREAIAVVARSLRTSLSFRPACWGRVSASSEQHPTNMSSRSKSSVDYSEHGAPGISFSCRKSREYLGASRMLLGRKQRPSHQPGSTPAQMDAKHLYARIT